MRQLLMPLVEKIESHEVPGQGGLDFLCTPKASSTVKCLTEVTNIDSAAISAKTGLTESIDDWEGGAIVSIVKKLMSKKQDKKKQIAKSVANLPLVRAITIFHEIIAHEHFLQSGTARLLRPETQRYFPNPCNLIAPTRSTWEAPIFNDSSFFKRGAGPKSYQSACLVLNPTAGRPISPDLLSDIQCCRLLYGWIMVDPCQWQVEWIDNPK